MAADGIPKTQKELAYNDRVIETLVIKKAEEYMEQLVLEQIKPQIKQIATEAVKDWIRVRSSTSSTPNFDPHSINYNIQFIEKVVNRMSDTVNITIHETKQK